MINQIKDLFDKGELGDVEVKGAGWFGRDTMVKMSLEQRSIILDSINDAIYGEETIDPAQGIRYIEDLKKNMTTLQTYQVWMRYAKIKALMEK